MDEEKELQDRPDVAGTADEVDVNAGNALQPAPAPSQEDLQSVAFDVSTSGASATDNQHYEQVPRTGLRDGVSALLKEEDNHHEQPKVPIDQSHAFGLLPQNGTDRTLDISDNGTLFRLSANNGSESPAHRVLELPPALDLADTGIIGPDAHPRPLITSEIPESIPDILEDVSLASPTTDAVMLLAAQQQSQQHVRSGLGISTHLVDNSGSEGSGALSGQQADHEAPGTGPEQGNPPAPQPSPKQPSFAYHHDDTDTTMAELEEFFSYVEVRGVVEEGRDSWARGWEAVVDAEWTTADPQIKRKHVSHLVEELEHRDPEIRFEAARRIAYLAHGTPIYSTSPQHHLHLVMSNCWVLREVGTLTAVHEALKSASGRWSVISTLSEGDNSCKQQHPYIPTLTPQERQEYLEEINGELAIHLSVLYFMVEIFRGDEAWADELMALDPPLPIYLFSLVAGLREKNAKGYPVKKLLLLLWKSMLACLGGNKDIKRVKAMVRHIEGLAEHSHSDNDFALKADPLDFANFRADIQNKYPTYQAPEIVTPIPQLPLEKLVATASSAPLKTNYGGLPAAAAGIIPPSAAQAGPLPPTPAPTPPSTPPPLKPKKQQYQTDQNKPFVLPFSRANLGGGHFSAVKGKAKMTVPYSIEEAGKLFKKNMSISTELWQLWKLREEYLEDETGGDRDSLNAQAVLEPGDRDNDLLYQLGLLSLDSNDFGSANDALIKQHKHGTDPLSMLYGLENKERTTLKAAKDNKAGLPHDNSTLRREEKASRQRITDIKKLQRIELLYRSTLSTLQSTVIVLLKLLLATVTANTNSNPNASESEAQPSQSLEDTDIMRHREITSKAVSAILILTLRWFKASHVMKFNYLAHLLVDSNCLLLILKMFGLQEVSNQVRLKNEVEEWNFFQFCNLSASQSPAQTRPEDAMLRPRPADSSSDAKTLDKVPADDDDEPEVITNFSRRNFFSVINFVHVLQKLTKRKAHRILLLVQYKSSAILKRILKVSHPLLQLYVLKVIKSQVPYCGRKWRQSNMKVITAIYLNCRPDLRDEWLTTIDIDSDSDESLVLRTLVRFFNTKHYGAYAPHLHRQSSSHLASHPFAAEGSSFAGSHIHVTNQASNNVAVHSLGHQNGSGFPSPSVHPHSLATSIYDIEAFPPSRSLSAMSGEEQDYRSSYIPDTLMEGYLEDYEDLLGDLFTPVYDARGMPMMGTHAPAHAPSASPGGTSYHNTGLPSPNRIAGASPAAMYMHTAEQAWHRLGEILGDSDHISDSESIASIGYLDLPAEGDGSDYMLDDGVQQGHNDWEHLSPDLASALEEDLQRQEAEARAESASPNRRKRSSSPRSPRLRRSSSGTSRSPALRPVFLDVDDGDDDDDGDHAIDEDEGNDDFPQPTYASRSPRRSPHLSPSKIAIDEVEAFEEYFR